MDSDRLLGTVRGQNGSDFVLDERVHQHNAQQQRSLDRVVWEIQLDVHVEAEYRVRDKGGRLG